MPDRGRGLGPRGEALHIVAQEALLIGEIEIHDACEPETIINTRSLGRIAANWIWWRRTFVARGPMG